MSHFSVIVIGTDVEKQLAPYHEFECTGIDDEYVQDIDITEETRKEYEKSTSRMHRNDVTGEMVSAHDDRFYREPIKEESEKMGPVAGTGFGKGFSWYSKDWGDGLGYRAKIHFLPDGWIETNPLTSDSKSFLEFVEDYHDYKPLAHGGVRGDDHKHGFVELNEHGDVARVVSRTNPNAKWDWYSVGGRWAGYFPLKPGAVRCVGEPGILTPDAEDDYGDMARIKDIDIEKAMNDQEERARNQFTIWEPCFTEYGRPRSWAEVRDSESDIEKAREIYRAQPAIRAHEETGNSWNCPVEELGFELDRLIAQYRNSVLIPYAVVKDGKWYGRGEMGWFGVSKNEMSDGEWEKKFHEMLQDLPPETMLTAVDCHI